mmetsp:Transcript_10832/g.28430  ORF Transcript_10832/g.28430 Transcript_10832/m.28430 type:complete len:239 (-) Transcript_10832:592-1308(-)
MKVLVEEVAISSAAEHDVRTSGDHVVKLFQGGEELITVLVDTCHVTKRVDMPVADVVADEKEEHEEGVVILLVASEGWQDGVIHRAHISTIHRNVLVVTMDAPVPLSHAHVDGIDRAGAVKGIIHTHVASDGRQHGPVDLIRRDVKHGVVRIRSDSGRIHVLGWDVEMGGGRVTQHDDTVMRGVSTVKVFVALSAGRVSALDAVAVMINIIWVRCGLPARVHGVVTVIAILSTPVRSA